LKVLYRLRQFNYIAYLVGGSVRDLLLERTPKDFDIGTSAHPYQVKRLFRRVMKAIGPKLEGAHFHNTRGLGIANALAAYEEGVRSFDSSMGGLGGCPFAPGASGNVITEDLVFMFESMGVKTGIDLQKLFVARKILAEAIPAEPIYGHIPVAGLPKGFRAAA